MRNIYLEMKSNAVGRVLAEPIFTKISSPNFHAAAMDGIAVDAKTTFGASETSPIQLNIGKDAFYINTGHKLPVETNAVIMIEHVNIIEQHNNNSEQIIEIEASVFPWQHVRKMGEDIVATKLLFTRNHCITPYCLGAFLTAGILKVFVKRKPKILIIPTGSELVDLQKTNLKDIQQGQVIESNSSVLGALAIQCGAEFQCFETIIDDFEKIKIAVTNAVDSNYDIILIIGGSSAGSKDFANSVVSSLGKLHFHGVTMMPGKPILFGSIKKLPRGSGSITTLTEADGIIRIPKHIEGIKNNEVVKAELLRPVSTIQNSIVVVGSHDNTLDLLSDNIRALNNNQITISSSHVGSIGGLMAIKKGVCHLSGSHLLDTESGLYNVSYIKKYLPNISVKLVNLVLRDQGLMILPGNPKKIKGIEDLQGKNISFINRQNGSGTRILFDYKLNQLGINPETIIGYENEEYTHMSVAVAVLSGIADVALGIYAAAKALGLDFIPIVTEQYDLVIPEIYFELDNIQILLETIRSDIFKKGVLKLGGYNVEKTGQIIDIYKPSHK